MTTASAKKSASASASALLPVYSHIEYPFQLERGEGLYVYDQAGRRYLDLYGGHCVCSVGHSHPEVTAAISAQAEKLMFYSNLAPIRIREEAAERLIAFAQNGFSSAFFCNSGAEANENALKIAVKATGRSKIAAFKGSFHGRTMLALGATDNARWHETYSGWLGPVERLTPNSVRELERIDGETAAVILEPIQSIGGVTVFETAYLTALRRRCDEQGALLIFDEVQTGVGRTGVPFVSGHCGIQPDMASLAKGLAGGFPIGAVMMTPEVASTIQPGDIAATFGGGPLAMAALIATISIIEREALPARAGRLEEYARKTFTGRHISEVRGKGLLLGLVLDTAAKPVQQALFDKGIITGTNSNGNLLHLLPPLTLEETHLDELRSALNEVLGE